MGLQRCDLTEYRVVLAVVRFGYVHRFYNRQGEWESVPDWPELDAQGVPRKVVEAMYNPEAPKRKQLTTSSDAKCGGIYDDCNALVNADLSSNPRPGLGHEELELIAQAMGMGALDRRADFWAGGRRQWNPGLVTGASGGPLRRYTDSGTKYAKGLVVKAFGDDADQGEADTWAAPAVVFYVQAEQLDALREEQPHGD